MQPNQLPEVLYLSEKNRKEKRADNHNGDENMARVPYADSNGSLSVEVELEHAANVFLVDDTNFRRFQSGQKFEYFGGPGTLIRSRTTRDRNRRRGARGNRAESEGGPKDSKSSRTL
jgi:hypothetical protein